MQFLRTLKLNRLPFSDARVATSSIVVSITYGKLINGGCNLHAKYSRKAHASVRTKCLHTAREIMLFISALHIRVGIHIFLYSLLAYETYSSFMMGFTNVYVTRALEMGNS